MRTRREPRSLREFYDEEERRALADLGASTTALGADLRRITRIDERVREHPWVALGAAAALGFAAAPLVSDVAGTLLPLATRTLREQPWIGSALFPLMSPARAGEPADQEHA